MGWVRQLHKLSDVTVIEKTGEATEDMKFCSQVVLDVAVLVPGHRDVLEGATGTGCSPTLRNGAPLRHK